MNRIIFKNSLTVFLHKYCRYFTAASLLPYIGLMVLLLTLDNSLKVVLRQFGRCFADIGQQCDSEFFYFDSSTADV